MHKYDVSYHFQEPETARDNLFAKGFNDDEVDEIIMRTGTRISV